MSLINFINKIETDNFLQSKFKLFKKLKQNNYSIQLGFFHHLFNIGILFSF